MTDQSWTAAGSGRRMRARRLACALFMVGLVGACSMTAPVSTSPAHPAAPDASAASTQSPSPGPTSSGSVEGLALDLTMSGPHINERLKTGLIPETSSTYCNWQASQNDPTVKFPAGILLDPQTVGGKGWSTFEFTDQDGPGSTSSGELDLAVTNGAGRLYYKWAPDSGHSDLSKGSATYSSDKRTVLLDVYAYDAKQGERGYTHVAGSIVCTP